MRNRALDAWLVKRGGRAWPVLTVDPKRPDATGRYRTRKSRSFSKNEHWRRRNQRVRIQLFELGPQVSAKPLVSSRRDFQRKRT